MSDVPWLFNEAGAFTFDGGFLFVIRFGWILQKQRMSFDERIAKVEELRAFETLEGKLRFVFGFPACVAYLVTVSWLDRDGFQAEFARAAADYNARDPRERG